MNGRIVSCLEGGYALSALARSVAAHLRVLAGADELVAGDELPGLGAARVGDGRLALRAH